MVLAFTTRRRKGRVQTVLSSVPVLDLRMKVHQTIPQKEKVHVHLKVHNIEIFLASILKFVLFLY
jgi:hypothetical protein